MNTDPYSDSISLGSRVHGRPVFSGQIIFGEGGEFAGRPVQKAIAACVDRVNHVLNVLEAACEAL